MKNKLLLVAATSLLSLQTAFAQTAKKAMAPPLNVLSVDILCNSGNFKDVRKKVHVVTDGTNNGLKITDAAGNPVATFTGIGGDYYTPPLSLAAGQTYKIFILNTNGTLLNPDPPHHNSPYTRTAPACGVERPLGPKISMPVQTKAFQ